MNTLNVSLVMANKGNPQLIPPFIENDGYLYFNIY